MQVTNKYENLSREEAIQIILNKSFYMYKTRFEDSNLPTDMAVELMRIETLISSNKIPNSIINENEYEQYKIK